MSAAINYYQAGFPPINSDFLPDDTPQAMVGQFIGGFDPYWGGRELVYAQATGAIRQFGLCSLTPTFASGRWGLVASEVPNTANLGEPLGVCMSAIGSGGGYGWFLVSGLVPVNSNASVAADTAFGIAAAGQAGAITAGKQILSARVYAPATTTVAKANCIAGQGSQQLQVTNTDGWFRGAYLSGTGIAAGTTVTSIDPSGRSVSISLATTAAVTGTVTATYNNATVFYNVAYLNRAFAQGQIT